MSARNPLQQRTASRRVDELPASGARPYVPRIALDWPPGLSNADHRRVDGTLLFADISGFTRLSERLAARGRIGAEEVVGIIGHVLTALVGEIEQRGGDVLIFAGDALVVLFEGADGPIRAARAGAAVRAWFATNGSIRASVGRVRLRVSIGIASGALDLVLAGHDDRGLFVAGSTTSRMVRLERAAQAGEILLDSETARSLDPTWLGPAHEQGRFLRRVTGPEPARSVLPVRRPAAGGNAMALVPRQLRPFLTGADRLESEHRLATVAFVLAGGLDRRLETEPSAAVADLGILLSAAAAAADRHRITLLGTDVTTDGVSLFLVAGAPIATGDDEERMLQALAEIVRMPGAERLQLRAGVNRGTVFAGDVGAPNRRTYTAMGDATNLAARIAARAGPGEILASSAVLDRSATEFESEALPAFVAKGKRELVVTHRVGRPHGRSARNSDRLPLTGRVVEFAVLDRALAAAQRGAGSTIVIVGEAGSGKSRLVQELLPDPRIAARLIIRFSPAAESSPYGGLRTGLRDLAGISSEAEPVAAGVALAAWIDRVAPASRQWLPLIAIPFGAAVIDSAEVSGIAPAFRRERLHAAIIAMLGATLSTPAVLVLEDLHWADEASFALLTAVAEAAVGRPWLVVALQRPGARMFGTPEVTRLDLAALDPGATVRLVLAAAGSVSLSDADLASISERAGGNPLFARVLVTAALERGSADDLPDRLESLLASRIDRLDGRGRALLRRAAVLGRTVDLDLLGEVLAGDDVANDPAAWRKLDEFIARTGPNQVRFRHDLVRAAAYEGLSHVRRRSLHERLARAIERRAGAELDEVAAVLALHFERSGDLEPAFRYARRAGDVARARYANVDAAVLYRQALGCAAGLRTLPPDEVATVAEARGDVAELAGRYDEALAGYALARHLGRSRVAASDSSARDDHARIGLAGLARKTGIVCERAGRYSAALAWYTRGRRALETAAGADPEVEVDTGVEALRVRLALDTAGIRFRQGRYAACVRDALPAAERARSIGQRELLAHAYYLLHAAYGDLGSPEAARYRDLSLPIYEELGDLVGQGNVLNNLGIEAYFEGRWDDALALYARSKEAKSRAGDIANAATQSNNEAEILSDQGRLAEAEALLADAVRVWRAAGYEIGVALATSNLGRAAARLGRHEAGLELLAEATIRFDRIGAQGYVDETQARLAEALVLAGRGVEAEAVGRATLARVRREASTSVLGAQLERTLGWAALQRGDAESAAARFAASLAEARALDARFEIALTQRARQSLPGPAGPERDRDQTEADAILAGLGVVTIPTPPIPGR